MCKLTKKIENQIKCELTEIESMIANNKRISVQEMFDLLVKYFKLRSDALEDAVGNNGNAYFEIHTDNTATTIYFDKIDNEWNILDVEIYIGDEFYELWDYEDIKKDLF